AEMYTLSCDACDQLRAEPLQRAAEMGDAAVTAAGELAGACVDLSGSYSDAERERLRGQIAAVHQLRLAAESVVEFCDAARAQLREGLLFSDAAYREMRELQGMTGSLVRDAIQSFCEGDAGVALDMAARGAAVEREIERLTEEHERRLISGACPVRNSAVFLDMLDSLRRLTAHITRVTATI
ncbi:MAG: hypothetical protein NT045_02730, partial [Candidatus Aureabacteria bacterium]|nr:hypothetical protein [Candidatus Auribacterota bacterium]